MRRMRLGIGFLRSFTDSSQCLSLALFPSFYVGQKEILGKPPQNVGVSLNSVLLF